MVFCSLGEPLLNTWFCPWEAFRPHTGRRFRLAKSKKRFPVFGAASEAFPPRRCCVPLAGTHCDSTQYKESSHFCFAVGGEAPEHRAFLTFFWVFHFVEEFLCQLNKRFQPGFVAVPFSFSCWGAFARPLPVFAVSPVTRFSFVRSVPLSPWGREIRPAASDRRNQ